MRLIAFEIACCFLVLGLHTGRVGREWARALEMLVPVLPVGIDRCCRQKWRAQRNVKRERESADLLLACCEQYRVMDIHAASFKDCRIACYTLVS